MTRTKGCEKDRIFGAQFYFKLSLQSVNKSPKTRGIKLCCSPNGQCVDGIEDICLGEVEDDLSVKVPDFQDALFVAPEDFCVILMH